MKHLLFIRAVFLNISICLSFSAFPQENTFPEKQDIQEPADKQAYSDLMERIKKQADLIITTAKKLSKKIPAERVFEWAAVEIEWVMQPLFGPANAWLFQERHYKLDELAKELKVTVEPKKMEQPRLNVEQRFEVQVVADVESLLLNEGWILEEKKKITSTELFGEPETTGALLKLKHGSITLKQSIYVFPLLPLQMHQTENTLPTFTCNEQYYIFGESGATIGLPPNRVSLSRALLPKYAAEQVQSLYFENGVVHVNVHDEIPEEPQSLLSHFNFVAFFNSIPSNNWGQPQKPCAFAITIHDGTKNYMEIHPLPL